MSIHDSKTTGPDGPLTVRSTAGVGPDRVVTLTLSEAFRKRFRVGRLLGEGGMGAVYHAVRLENREEVALKFLILGGDADSLLRFMQEGDLLGRIAHPHVLAIHEMGIEGACPYLVCEYLSGGTLSARIRRGPLPPAEAARIGAEVFEGLQAIHEAGVVHRDLKPSNVMFDARGLVRVTDLGVARLAESCEKLTRTGAFVGTPTYFSPEQSTGEVATASADIYAGALLIHEMLAGRPPFVADDLRTLLRMQHDELPPTLSEIVPGVPAALSDLVLECLEKAPQDRPGTAAQVADRLRAIAAATPPGLPGAASPGAPESDRPTPPTRARSRPIPRVTRSAPTPRPTPRAPSRRSWLALLLLPLLALALRSRAPAPPPAAPGATPAPATVAAPRSPSVFVTLASRAGGIDAIPAPMRLVLRDGERPPTERPGALPGVRARVASRQLTRADLGELLTKGGMDFGRDPPTLGHFIELDDFLQGRGPRPRRLATDLGEIMNPIDEVVWTRALDSSSHKPLPAQLAHAHRGVAASSVDARGWYALGAIYAAEGQSFAAKRAFAVARSSRQDCGHARWTKLHADGFLGTLEDENRLEERWRKALACDHAAPSLVRSAASLFAETQPERLERLLAEALEVPVATAAALAQQADLALARGEPEAARTLLASRTVTSTFLDGSVARRGRLELSRGRGDLAGRLLLGSTDPIGNTAHALCWPDDPSVRPPALTSPASNTFQPVLEQITFDDAPLRAMQVVRYLEAGDVAAAEQSLRNTEDQHPMCWPWERLELAALMAGSTDAGIKARVLAALAEPMSGARVLLFSELAGHAATHAGRARPYVDAFVAGHGGTPWPALLAALTASRRGLHRPALDVLKNAIASDTERVLDRRLVLEVALRPVWDGVAAGESADPALVEAAAPGAGAAPHLARIQEYVSAVRKRDFDAARQAALTLFDDDPVVPLWQASTLWWTALRKDEKAGREQARVLAATARWWATSLWWLAQLDATGYRPR